MARLAQTDGLTQDQRDILMTVRAFVDQEILPYATELEHKDEFPTAIVDAMKEMGLFGLMIDEEYGGLGESLLTYALVVEEIARGWMSISGIINTHFMLAYLLRQHGTDERKQHFLPRMATGEIRGAFSMSEPGCGSDVGAITTKAVRDGDDWVLNGQKMWITNGRIEKMGYKGVESTEMILSDHRVPTSRVLGGEAGIGRGFYQMMDGIEMSRVNVAARGSGVALRAFGLGSAYAQQRVAFGKPIAQHQAIQFKLAEMATKVEAAHALMVRAARVKDAGERNDLEAGMAKYRLYREAPMLLIGEGTAEIQKMIIGRRLLEEYAITNRWPIGGAPQSATGARTRSTRRTTGPAPTTGRCRSSIPLATDRRSGSSRSRNPKASRTGCTSTSTVTRRC